MAAVAEYTQSDARQFSIEEQQVATSLFCTPRLSSEQASPPLIPCTPQGRSPTMAILADLNSHGWSVVDLAYLAHRAHLGIVVDTIREHCRSRFPAFVCRSSCEPVSTQPTITTAFFPREGSVSPTASPLFSALGQDLL